MKHIVMILILFSIFSCSGIKKTVTHDSFHVPNDLKEFLVLFEKASIEHNKQSVLELTDENYLKEQHDQMLQGRTDQFLNELYCGEQINGKGFKCPGFENITELELTDIKNNPDSYTVHYIVITGKIKIRVEWHVAIKKTESGNKYGIVGALG